MYNTAESWLPNSDPELRYRVHTIKFQCSLGIRKIIQA